MRTIPLYIHPAFWLLAALIAWTSSVNLLQFGLWVIVVLLSVVVHEFGHALTARMWKQKVHIELQFFGGVTVREGPKVGKIKEFIIVLMGPIASLLLAFIAIVLRAFAPNIDSLIFFYISLATANIFWGILNLIPVLPLDGGKLVAIMFEGVLGPKGVRFAHLSSAIFAAASACVFFSYDALFPALFFLLFTYENARAFMDRRAMPESDQDRRISDEISLAEQEWVENRHEEAIDRLQKLLATNPNGNQLDRTLELLSGFLVATNQTQKAYDILLENRKMLSLTLLKQMQSICYTLGKWQESIEYGKLAFIEDQDLMTASMNGLSAAKLHKIDEAVNWLRAVKRGDGVLFTTILESKELDQIRNEEKFKSLVAL